MPIFAPGQAETEDTRRGRIIQAWTTLAPLLAGATLLGPSAWNGGYPESVGVEQQLSWDPEKSTLSLTACPPNQVPRLSPWAAEPVAVYANPDADLVVVELVYDPLETFVDGANLVTRFEIVDGVALGLGRNWRDGIPSDVVAFVERYAWCNHWGGEEAYSRERRKEIEAAVEDLRCRRLDADGRKLRAKYAGKPKIVKTIAAAPTFDGD